MSRFAVGISPADVGARVSIRTRLPAPAPDGPTATDTVGHLRAWQEGILEVERRDGTLVRLAERDLIAAKRIPPAPQRRAPAPRDVP